MNLQDNLLEGRCFTPNIPPEDTTLNTNTPQTTSSITNKEKRAAYMKTYREKMKQHISHDNDKPTTSSEQCSTQSIRERNFKYKERNLEHVRELRQKRCSKYKAKDPENYKAINERKTDRYKAKNLEHFRAINKKKTDKYKIIDSQNFNSLNRKRKRLHDKKNSLSVSNNPAVVTQGFLADASEGISRVIEEFHRILQEGPEYVCTCCDQLWYKSSVLECNPDKYEFENMSAV